MLFPRSERDMYVFYESLSEGQREKVEDKVADMIPELRVNGIGEGEIYDLKCIVAKDMFKLLRG